MLSHAPTLHAADYFGPVAGAVVFIAIMALVREPLRHNLNALLAAGASGVYLSGGLGAWEVICPVLVMPVVVRGLRSYPFIGVAWLMHAGWDVVHHLYGSAIWPFMPTSSFGCMIFDTVIACWFFAGARGRIAARQT
jgi:Family of unknown function (DUF6010)